MSLQVIHRLYLPYLADEIHHTGWNACSSVFDNPNAARDRLIVPGLLSSRIYAIDVATNPLAPRIDEVCISIFTTERYPIFLNYIIFFKWF